MKAIIDREGCIGCGLCASLCEDVFQMADDGLAEVHGEVTGANQDCVQDAIDSCPVSVISMDEE